MIQALGQYYNESVEDLSIYLDLVATAIGADIVPVVGENRILAYYGLVQLNINPRPGFKGLIKNIKKHTLNLTDVIFVIAPRINAAGRMKHGNYAVSLLKEKESKQVKIATEEIESFNSSRRSLDKITTKEALSQIDYSNEIETATTVVYNPNWNKGVIGIVASRLIEKYYRPTIVFTKSGDFLTASARSVSGFDIYQALQNCSQYIEQFGGHKYAAGLSIKEENYFDFRSAFESEVKSSLPSYFKTPELVIDTDIGLNSITPKFYRILKQFEPFGPQNMAPVFTTTDVFDSGYAKCVGEDNKHLKMSIYGDNSNQINCIGFGLGSKISIIQNKDPIKIAYTIDENYWNGKASLQLKIKDIKPT